jgi:uncharacterized protein YdaU (DUF1376 family)
MATVPYMPLYISDYLTDTIHLTTLEHGAYLLLIMHYWQTGKPLPADDAKLCRIANVSKQKWIKIKKTLTTLFSVCELEWRHGRVDHELEKMRAKSMKSRAAGIISAEKKKEKNSTSVEHPLNGRSTSVERTFNQQNRSEQIKEKEPTVLVNGKPSTPVDNFFLKKEKKDKILPDCPYAQILSEFEKILPELPQPVTLSDGRKKHVLARWKENPEIGYFLQVFHGVQQSDFLMGRRLDKNQRSWRASFDWIMTARNWEKIVDGNYDNK